MIHLLHFFNTMNSGLVHLIQGLCAQILFEIRDYRWVVFTSFAFLFRKEKYFKEKMQLVLDPIPPPSIYVHMYQCTFKLYTYTSTCLPRFSPSGFFRPSRCLVPTLWLTLSTPCTRAQVHALWGVLTDM